MDMNSKFPLGQIVATQGALSTFEPSVLQICLNRHANGDGGDLCKEDKEQNTQAIKSGNYRVFSVYVLPQGKLWVITEADRSVTTCLLPCEY